MRPFLLRRLKKDVAKQLPGNLIRIAYCYIGDKNTVLLHAVTYVLITLSIC